MCNNAMTYNRPETVYYKEAKRLLHIAAKQLSKVSPSVLVTVHGKLHLPRERERERIRMIDSFRQLPLMKGCRWMTYHLTVKTERALHIH